MSGRLEGQVAIVTGAGRGIGEGIAKRFAREGAAVVAAQRTPEEGDRVVEEIVADGGRAISVRTDVGDPESVEALVKKTLEAYGSLDAIVNNAGVGLIRSVVDTSMDEYDTLMDINLRGVFLCMKYAIPPMLEQGSGSVINIASVASFVAFPDDAAYCASKGGVLMLTRQAALDYSAKGVRINAICPGFIETPMLLEYCDGQGDPEATMAEVVAMHPAGRLGQVDDVASAAVYFASEDSAWVTGTSLPVDGGMLVRP